MVLRIGNAPYTSKSGNYALQLELLHNIQDLSIRIDLKLNFHIHTDTVVKRVLGLICKSLSAKIQML